MGLATNILIILFCVNLVIWLAGEPYYRAASPVFLLASKIAGDQRISWNYVLSRMGESFLMTAAIVGALIGIMAILSTVTGSVQIGTTVGGGGSGFGAAHALAIAAIIIFTNFAAMPNFSKMFAASQYSGGGTQIEVYNVTSSSPNPGSYNPWFLVELIIRGIFGFLIVLGIFGILRGE